MIPVSQGKPCAGNPHARFEEGVSAPESPRRNALLNKEICSVPNPWAFCLSWKADNPKLLNKFMDMCAYFKKDDSFISHKVNEPEYLYHKKLKMDVSVTSTIPDEKGRICFWHTNRWLHDKKELFSEPKKTF